MLYSLLLWNCINPASRSKNSVSLEIKKAFYRWQLFVNVESKRFPYMVFKCIPVQCQVLCTIRPDQEATRGQEGSAVKLGSRQSRAGSWVGSGLQLCNHSPIFKR